MGRKTKDITKIDSAASILLGMLIGLFCILIILGISACGKKDHDSFVAGKPVAEKTEKVIYVGGCGATKEQVGNWLLSAMAKDPSRYYRGFGYPVGANCSDISAISKGKDTIEKAIADIEGNPNLHYIVAGHSSGAAVSNAIAERVKTTNLRLVDLDGFTPSKALQKKVPSICWYAQNGNIGSANSGAMKSACTNHKGFQTNVSTNPWVLHMSLVNKNANNGYDNMDANLDWVTNE